MNFYLSRLLRALPLSMAFAATLLCVGCGQRSSITKTHAMGERVLVGQFYVTALETRWETQLGGGGNTKLPNNRFLVVKVSITNQGGQERTAPLFTLEGAKGQTYREFQDGSVIPQWLGLIRRVGPAMTDTGDIVFDVPSAAYKLRITVLGEGEDVDKEPSEVIELPLTM